MLKKLCIILFADLLLISIFLAWTKPDPSVAIGEIVFIIILVILNLALGFILLTNNHKDLGIAFFINSLPSAIIFQFLFGLWFEYYNKVTFDNRYFTREGKRYELTVYRKSDYFFLSDITNKEKGSTYGILFGHYQKSLDTVYLADNSKEVKIYGNVLVGYPERSDTIILNSVR